MRQAWAGHGDEAQITPLAPLAYLMPHELGMLVAGLAAVVLILCALLCLALYRISRLERRIASMEDAHPGHGTSPGHSR